MKLIKIKEDVKNRLRTYFLLRDDGTLVVGSRLCMPNNLDLKNQILEKAHSLVCAMHSGSTMMYHILREHYWWQGMKREIIQFIAHYITCQQVKAEHQKPVGESQPLSIPEWKQEDITMDFVIGLPRTSSGYNSLQVIVDRLTKSAHFLPYKSTQCYNDECVCKRNSTFAWSSCVYCLRQRLTVYFRVLAISTVGYGY